MLGEKEKGGKEKQEKLHHLGSSPRLTLGRKNLQGGGRGGGD